MSRAVSAISRWRVGERTGGSRGGGVPRGVMMAFLWHGGGIPERFAWLIGRGGVRLKGRETVDQGHQLGRMQQGEASMAAGWWVLRDSIGRPGRQCQDTAIRVLHKIFEQLSHSPDVAERERMATQGVHRIPDRDRS
jgi:hypothetical protein